MVFFFSLWTTVAIKLDSQDARRVHSGWQEYSAKDRKLLLPDGWILMSIFISAPIWLLSQTTLLCKMNLASRQSSCSLACRKCVLKHPMCFLLPDQKQISSVDIAMSRRLLQGEPFPSLWRRGSLHWTDVPECYRLKTGRFQETLRKGMFVLLESSQLTLSLAWRDTKRCPRSVGFRSEVWNL